jgi:PrtD family type I secretion system ABC transporter
MRWLFAKRLRPFVLLAACASLVLNVMLLMPAIYMMQVFDRVFASRSLETLAMLSLIVALALLLAYAMDVVRGRALAWAGGSLERRLAPAALRAALDRAAQPGRIRDADSLRDIGSLRNFLSGRAVSALFDAPWVPLYLLVITAMHPLLGASALAGVLALFALALATDMLTRRMSETAQGQSRTIQRRTQSLLRHADAIAGMGMTAAALASWRDEQDLLLGNRGRLGERSAELSAAARVVRQALQTGLLGVGAWLVIGEHASPGIMVAATILFGRALQPVEQLIAGWKSLIDARAAWGRLQQPGTAAGSDERLELPAPQGRVELQQVVFGGSAQRAPLIKGVSFALEPGESLGVVGPSACGKTTLLRLLLGIWKPHSGSVRLDGADIAHWDRDRLGPYIGYLPQDVELFAGSVAQNIARLGEVDDGRVVAAAKLAHAHEMILRLPSGYDTPIGDSGAMLSGGQRQRIALARALYGEPRLVVLDEPNANLDAEGDAALAAALRELKQRAVTVIVVSHRPALMSQLDKIAVLRDGVLEAFGPVASVLRPVARSSTARPNASRPAATRPTDSQPAAAGAASASMPGNRSVTPEASLGGKGERTA